jgi:hypothetical protein
MQKEQGQKVLVRKRKFHLFAPIINLFRLVHRWAELEDKQDYVIFYTFLVVLFQSIILRGLKAIIEFLIG